MSQNTTSSTVAAAASASANLAVAQAALDRAFEALKTYDHGSSRAALLPIDNAVAAALGDAAAGKELEKRLVGVLKSNVSPVAKDYVCRKLGLIGSAASVPALSAVLADEALSHIARSTLERVPGPEAIKALRERLPKLRGLQKAGVINSLGTRRDAESVTALAALLNDSDSLIAGAAAAALGDIATAAATKALLQFRPKAADSIRPALADACLACAERCLAERRRADALALYESLCDSPQPKHIQLAARRGLSSASEKK